jgi:hypothetical protein
VARVGPASGLAGGESSSEGGLRPQSREQVKCHEYGETAEDFRAWLGSGYGI